MVNSVSSSVSSNENKNAFVANYCRLIYIGGYLRSK